MLFLLEIIAVVSAILVLLTSTAVAGRRGWVLFKSFRMMAKAATSKTSDIFERADAAQRRAFSILETRELLFRRLSVLERSLAGLIVLVAAARQTWSRVSAALGYVGV